MSPYETLITLKLDSPQRLTTHLCMQTPSNPDVQRLNGVSGKNAKRMRKALQQLEQEEAAPKKARIFSPAEMAEGIK